MMTQVEMRDRLVEALERDLVGPMADGEVLRDPPSRWYLTGFLVPREADPSQRIDPTATEELDAGLDGPDDDDRGDTVRPPSQPFLPSSMGLSVLVPPAAQSLQIEARWADYTRLSEEESATFDDREERDDGEAGETRVRLRWRRLPRDPSQIDVPVRDGLHTLPGSGGVCVLLVVRHAPAVPGIPEGTRAVNVFLVNQRDPLEGPQADERSLFQTELVVRADPGFVPRVRVDQPEHPDDRRDDLQYRDHREWAVGHGVATDAEEIDGAVHEIRTAWVPRARVYRMAAESHGAPLEMEKLAEMDAVQLRTALEPMLGAYEAWLSAQSGRAKSLSPERATTAAALLAEARGACARIRYGLGFLEAEPNALTAFQLTQRAMAMAARQVRPGMEPRWRLFQLAFVLLNVRGVGDPASDERAIADLLFFPTGGGKTEAYLGVAAFTMLLRRLRHREARHEGAGVTVLLRYTLRLLTLDQLGRAATLTCALELLRRSQPRLLGTRRFSVGLWVGRKATANTLEAAGKQYNAYRMARSASGKAPPVPLVGCPWCGTPFSAGSYDLHKEQGKVQELRVGCEHLGCPFGFEPDERGLPVVVVDEQIYRELPTFLIATVDKFAALPWRGATGSLFGRVTACDERGFYGQHETDPKGSRKLHDGVPPPELVIQDELHLITGPLGTMVGLFETAIDRLCRTAEGGRPKLLASTATARRATEQIRALYARPEVRLFPPQGLDDGDTFFASRDVAEDKARVYVGIAAPGRSSKAVMARVYTTLLGASYKLWYGRAAGEDNLADTYMTLVGYFNALHELGGARRLVLEEVAPRVARIDLRRPEGQEKSDYLARRTLAFDPLELTSRESTDAIREAKGKLENPYSPKDGRRTDVLLASSMISVGVDIPRLGLMVVNGQPRTVAEYIQATSRVGRSTPGLVVTLYNLFKPRDRSHYERFVAFHDCFYRHVESASVTPFSSRALERGLAGLTVGLARHTDSRLAHPRNANHVAKAPSVVTEVEQSVVERARAHREEVADHLAEEVGKKVRDLFVDWAEIADDLERDGVSLAYSAWEKVRGSAYLMSTAVDKPNDRHAKFEHFRAPTSMRDVEPTVHFWVNRGWSSEDT